MSKLIINLTETQEQLLTLAAIKSGYEQDWKQYAKDEFLNKVIGQKIGAPKISSVSAAKSGRVTASSRGEM